MEASESCLTCHAAGEPSPFAGLDEIQTKLRHAVEGGDYACALSLIEDQRNLFEYAGKTHPEIQSRAHAAHDLCISALTLIRLRREQLHRNLEEMSARKRVISCYAATIPSML